MQNVEAVVFLGILKKGLARILASLSFLHFAVDNSTLLPVFTFTNHLFEEKNNSMPFFLVALNLYIFYLQRNTFTEFSRRKREVGEKNIV